MPTQLYPNRGLFFQPSRRPTQFVGCLHQPSPSPLPGYPPHLSVSFPYWVSENGVVALSHFRDNMLVATSAPDSPTHPVVQTVCNLLTEAWHLDVRVPGDPCSHSCHSRPVTTLGINMVRTDASWGQAYLHLCALSVTWDLRGASPLLLPLVSFLVSPTAPGGCPQRCPPTTPQASGVHIGPLSAPKQTPCAKATMNVPNGSKQANKQAAARTRKWAKIVTPSWCFGLG